MESVCLITVVIKLVIYLYTAVECKFATLYGRSHHSLLWLMKYTKKWNTVFFINYDHLRSLTNIYVHKWIFLVHRCIFLMPFYLFLHLYVPLTGNESTVGTKTKFL